MNPDPNPIKHKKRNKKKPLLEQEERKLVRFSNNTEYQQYKTIEGDVDIKKVVVGPRRISSREEKELLGLIGSSNDDHDSNNETTIANTTTKAAVTNTTMIDPKSLDIIKKIKGSLNNGGIG